MPVTLRAYLLAALLGSTGARSASVKRTEILWGDNYPKEALFVEGSSLDAQPQNVQQSSSCSRLNQRKSWNVLTDGEKKAYIDAELCLLNSPPRSGTPGARNRFEELQFTHMIQMPFIHYVGSFLLWHRYFVRLHEQFLQEECGYQGAQPYWDEIADQADFPNVPIFDPQTGFGGDGGERYCIEDGPFKDVILHFGPEGSQDYCLWRGLNQTYFTNSDQEMVSRCLSYTTFADAWPCIEAYPHGGGHVGIGGLMLNISLSPGDPLFYLHHTFLDKVYWDWQQLDPDVRLRDMSGTNLPLPDVYALGGTPRFPPSAILDYNGDPGNATTLNHTLWMNGLGPNITIGDVMDLNKGPSCAEYV